MSEYEIRKVPRRLWPYQVWLAEPGCTYPNVGGLVRLTFTLRGARRAARRDQRRRERKGDERTVARIT